MQDFTLVTMLSYCLFFCARDGTDEGALGDEAGDVLSCLEEVMLTMAMLLAVSLGQCGGYLGCCSTRGCG